MMSSSELQRISLAANKVVSLEGTIDLQPLTEADEDDRIDRHDDDDEDDDDDDDDANSDRKSDINMTSLTISSVTGGAVGGSAADRPSSSSGAAAGVKINGHHSPGNDVANTTTTSSVGDLTLDSIRDHLNSSTITTLHKQTTEEVVGKFRDG